MKNAANGPRKPVKRIKKMLRWASADQVFSACVLTPILR
jgi:hypothetical protein